MRRTDKEITVKTDIEEIIDKAEFCSLAMCDGEKPFAVPMNFGYENGKVYFHSAREGKKIEILKKNSAVCIHWAADTELSGKEEPCSWTMKFRSVIAEGTASFVSDSAEKTKALNLIMKKYSGRGDFEFPANALNSVEIIRIDISAMTGKKSGY
jgi:nitroimidazol reductase NimA-like FMN-containing flavoprotein (pyridoxamine 5'-phosphate oxidase superfamily)